MPGKRVFAAALAILPAAGIPAFAGAPAGAPDFAEKGDAPAASPPRLRLAALPMDAAASSLRDGPPADRAAPVLPDLLDAGRAALSPPLLRGTVAPREPDAPENSPDPTPEGDRGDGRDFSRPGGRLKADPALRPVTRKPHLALPRPLARRHGLPEGGNASVDATAPDALAGFAYDLRRDGARPRATEGPWVLPSSVRPPPGVSYVARSFSASAAGDRRFGVGLGYEIAPLWTVQAGVLAPGLFTGIAGRF